MSKNIEQLTQLIDFHKRQAQNLLFFYNFNGQQFFAIYQERVEGDPTGRHIDPIIIDNVDEVAQFKQLVSGLIAWHNIKAFQYAAIVEDLKKLTTFKRVLGQFTGLNK